MTPKLAKSDKYSLNNKDLKSRWQIFWNRLQLTSIGSEMNAMTTHQVVIKAHRHKKLQLGHYLKFGYGWHFQSFFFAGGGGEWSALHSIFTQNWLVITKTYYWQLGKLQQDI